MGATVLSEKRITAWKKAALARGHRQVGELTLFAGNDLSVRRTAHLHYALKGLHSLTLSYMGNPRNLLSGSTYLRSLTLNNVDVPEFTGVFPLLTTLTIKNAPGKRLPVTIIDSRFPSLVKLELDLRQPDCDKKNFGIRVLTLKGPAQGFEASLLAGAPKLGALYLACSAPRLTGLLRAVSGELALLDVETGRELCFVSNNGAELAKLPSMRNLKRFRVHGEPAEQDVLEYYEDLAEAIKGIEACVVECNMTLKSDDLDTVVPAKDDLVKGKIREL
ncbi:hypothetical protein JCM10449v2_006222 [Rhodotorula kratochvilovae]